MPKRFTATEIWDEDWFLSMPKEYKLFWFYMLSTCDHAGLFKVNYKSFCGLVEVKLTPDRALVYFNHDKQRIRVVKPTLWLIEDFFVYQYGTTFNPNNRLHLSISELYLKQGIELTSIRGLLDLKDGVKDKDKEINKDKRDVPVKKMFIPPTLQEVKDYFREKGYSEIVAAKAFEYYDTAKWKDSKGDQVRNWKQKMISVWFKDENKNKITGTAEVQTVLELRQRQREKLEEKYQ